MMLRFFCSYGYYDDMVVGICVNENGKCGVNCDCFVGICVKE